MVKKKERSSVNDTELIDKDGPIDFLKKKVDIAASGVTELYDKATDTVRSMLDRILNSTDKTDTEAMVIFRESIKAMDEDIANELAKDKPNYDFVIMMQDKKKAALDSVQVIHGDISKRDTELFKIGASTVVIISGMVLKGLEVWLNQRKV